MKYTKQERSWIWYDVANSAFVLIMSSTLPIYFHALAAEAGVASNIASSWFALSTSLAVLIVALLAPVIGSIADYRGMKKRLFVISLAVGILGGLTMIIQSDWQAFLWLFVLARLGYSICNVFYDSMLVDVTSDERMDSVSGAGYAWGYVGSTVPFIAGIIIIFTKPFGLTTVQATQVSFLIIVAWWALLSIPLLRHVHQTHYKEREKNLVSKSFKNLAKTFKEIIANKKMFYFILAYFFYIDGVYTIISQAASFGAEVGIDGNTLIIALLLTQFVAFPFAILSGRMAKAYGVIPMLKIYIGIYTFTAAFGYFLAHAWQFWVLCVLVGMAQGGIQSLSRSYFGRMVPKESSNEYFGFFDIFGKYADFFGPLLMAASARFLGHSKYGILAIIILFILGYYFLTKVERIEKEETVL